MAATKKVVVKLNKPLIKKLENAGPAAMGKLADKVAVGARARATVSADHKDPWPGVEGPLRNSIEPRMRKNPDDGAMVLMHYYGFFEEFKHDKHSVDRAVAAAESQIDSILDAVT